MCAVLEAKGAYIYNIYMLMHSLTSLYTGLHPPMKYTSIFEDMVKNLTPFTHYTP
jgi:hypothetical protein